MRWIAAACALLLTAADLHAHDFWIEPSTFRPAPGTIVAIGLRVGQNFVGDPVPRFSRMIGQFIVRQGAGEQEVNGTETVDPAGWLRADGQTTAVVAYRSAGSFIELPADKFEDYLRQEGLDRIIELRAKRRETAKPGRERFYRYAKALLAGPAPSAAATQPVGLAYEIVPDDDPAARVTPFRGRVLHDGRPIPDAIVVAMLHSDPAVQLKTHTDAQGRFAFSLPRDGVWLIKSVHMARASFFSDADWDSLWASLTFEIRGPAP